MRHDTIRRRVDDIADSSRIFVAGCLLVMGVGMHNFNGARLFDIGCEGCGDRWLEVATERHLVANVISRPPVGDATIVKKGRRVNSSLEAASHRLWPIPQRVAFFARLGAPTDVIVRALRNAVNRSQREQLAEGLEDLRCEHAPMLRDTEDYRDRWATFFPRCDGSHSMTILRHPFTRATSAFFYRGHSPNYDVFDLRPGLWYPPSVRYTGMTLHEYFSLPEYSNVLTKLFGRSTECKDAQLRGCTEEHVVRPAAPRDPFKCASFAWSRSRLALGICSVYGGCHAYRNATLDASDADKAVSVLNRHAFVGFQEVPTASALLAARTFNLSLVPESIGLCAFLTSTADVAGDDDVELGQTRTSKNLVSRCSPALAMRSDPTACRAAFEGSHLDIVVFETVHREFCRRLEASGLATDARVVEDLARANFCGSVDFANPDQICGRLETEDSYAKLDELRASRERSCSRAFSREHSRRQTVSPGHRSAMVVRQIRLLLRSNSRGVLVGWT